MTTKQKHVPRLFLNGVQFSINQPSKGILKIKSFLDKSPPDQLFKKKDIVAACNISVSTITDFNQRDGYHVYFTHVGNTNYYGNPKAIKTLIALNAEASE